MACVQPDGDSTRRVHFAWARSILGSPDWPDSNKYPGCRPDANGRIGEG
jgi:hypothetical protein